MRAAQVKQRRLEREAERAAREAEAAQAARAREALQFHTWAKHEDAFHLHQARLRSQIRIRDGRGACALTSSASCVALILISLLPRWALSTPIQKITAMSCPYPSPHDIE